MTESLLDRIAGLGAAGALIDDATGIETSFAALADQARDATDLLRAAGISAGDVVKLDGEAGARTLALLLALQALAAVVALDTSTVPAERSDKAALARAVWQLRPETGHRPEAIPPEGDEAPLVAQLRAAGRAGLILFSSGTTGRPKAMLHDLDRLSASYLGGPPRSKPLRLLLFLMFDHIGGINTIFSSLAQGTTLVLPAERTPMAVAGAIARHRVQVLPASPTFLNLMLMSGAVDTHDLSTLRMITYGTEPMPEGLLGLLRSRLPRARLLQTFGTSETGIVSTVSRASTSLAMRFDDEAVEHRIVDGELWLRSRRRIVGYLNHPMDAFTDDGWFRTGDLVEETPDGFLTVKGRAKEIINVGGEKVFPAEVEGVLMASGLVADCKVFGQPNAITGQAVMAEIVPAPDAVPADPAALIKAVKAHARERLDPFKVPVRVKIVSDIPYSARFKKLISREAS